MNVLLKKATDKDKEFLRNLNRIVYEEAVIEQFGRWDDVWQNSYFDEKWKGADNQIIRVDDKSIGTLWTIDEKDYICIRELQILPEFQGCGIGTALIKRELKKAKVRELPIQLRVLKANKARYFYEGLGFLVYDETETQLYMQNAI
jgi:GNAT superfamily N-acetyltransferase